MHGVGLRCRHQHLLSDLAQLARHWVVVVDVLSFFKFLRFLTTLCLFPLNGFLVDLLLSVSVTDTTVGGLDLALVVEVGVAGLFAEIAPHDLDLYVFLMAIVNVLIDELGSLKTLVTLVAPEVLCGDLGAVLLVVDLDLLL